MIYYAHCMRNYHTKDEAKTLADLHKNFEVFNPSTDGDIRKWGTRGMGYFIDIIKKYGITACYAEPVNVSGTLAWTSGVYWEMQHCIKYGIPIIYADSVTPGKYVRVLTRDETRSYICHGDV